MKEFISTQNLNFTFGDCANCEAKCCNGKHGTLFSQIILSEFEKVYKNFPILFIFGDLNFIKPVVLLTNGKEFCPYLEDYKCSIYENRPTVCKTYPLSPNLDNKIYIDTLCPEVDKKSISIVKDNTINSGFDNDIFYNYQNKYIETHFTFEKFNKKYFKIFLTINNIDFFTYTGPLESKYMKMHIKSLENYQFFNLNQ
jgi:Fe-S-cluster containining protein